MRHWLFKSEPDCYSVSDLEMAPHQTTSWDGVRNYQARNFMRDDMKPGDLGFFYHSGKNPEIAGIVEVVRSGYPDHTAQDPENEHFDLAATAENPRWFMVDVKLVRRFCPPIPRSRLKFRPALDGMELLKPGSRLSVQPVEAEAFRDIVELADTLAAGSGAGARQSAPGRDSVEFADTLAAGSEKEKTFTAASRKKEDTFSADSGKKEDAFTAGSRKKEDAFVAGSRKKEDAFTAGSEKKENMFADGWEKKND